MFGMIFEYIEGGRHLAQPSLWDPALRGRVKESIKHPVMSAPVRPNTRGRLRCGGCSFIAGQLDTRRSACHRR